VSNCGLYIFSGLPGTGKSELAKFLSEKYGAVYLRIDTIEQTLRDNGISEVEGKGYEIAYKIASDNLMLGLPVVADSVNPLEITRKAWRNVATNSGCKYYEIEVICSDKEEHKQRIESRTTDIEGLKLPTWNDVINRNYETWTRERIVIDTAGKSITDSQVELVQQLKNM
jgi:predicted kinase